MWDVELLHMWSLDSDQREFVLSYLLLLLTAFYQSPTFLWMQADAKKRQKTKPFFTLFVAFVLGTRL
jgi:hypothetical protein